MANIFKDSSLYAQIKAVADSLGLPESIWVPIAKTESGGESAAHALTTKEDSWGVFQLNRKGGQGSGYLAASLVDPVNNAKIGLKPIAAAYQKGVAAGYSGEELYRYTLVNSGHPGKLGMDDTRLDRFVRNFRQPNQLYTPPTFSLNFNKPQTVTGAVFDNPATPGIENNRAGTSFEKTGEPGTFVPNPGDSNFLAMLKNLAVLEKESGLLDTPKKIALMIILALLGLIIVAVGLITFTGGVPSPMGAAFGGVVNSLKEGGQ